MSAVSLARTGANSHLLMSINQPEHVGTHKTADGPSTELRSSDIGKQSLFSRNDSEKFHLSMKSMGLPGFEPIPIRLHRHVSTLELG